MVFNARAFPDFVVAAMFASWTFQRILDSHRGMVAVSRSTLT